MSRYSKYILIVSGAICLILAVINANQEYSEYGNRIGLEESLQIVGFSALAFIVMLIWELKSKEAKESVFHLIPSILVSSFGLFFYTMYVVGGASNPNGAGHMHVFVFPVLHLVFACIVLVTAVLFIFVKRRFTSKRENSKG